MKRTYSVLAMATLMLAALASCKKDDDKPTSPNVKTQTPPPGNPNPLTTKACRGMGIINIENTPDSVMCTETLFEPLKLFAIYASGGVHSLAINSGLKKLPVSNTVFNILGDNSKQPASNEMILSYYDEETEKDYYAQSGTVSYTITSSAKTAKFSNITFKSDQNDTKVLSFEVVLK